MLLILPENILLFGEIENALVIGVEVLSKYTNPKDIGTAILLGDGAGATLIGRSKEQKKYCTKIESEAEKGEILTCHANQKIYMDGKSVYKYAISKTVENVETLLKENGEEIKNIKYIIPHQSNIRILEKISEKLKIDFSKLYVNIQEVGNTFCASIPIALDEMIEKKLIAEGDKIILLGYGGGLNLGSILLEI